MTRLIKFGTEPDEKGKTLTREVEYTRKLPPVKFFNRNFNIELPNDSYFIIITYASNGRWVKKQIDISHFGHSPDLLLLKLRMCKDLNEIYNELSELEI